MFKVQEQVHTAAPLKLIGELLDQLDAGRISYSHWKSNWKLECWAKGEGDLDLLVARDDVQAFTSILYKLGFKEALPPGDQQLPGILHFYGFDAEARRFVHIHAHYQLVLGHDLTKNYHLPIEKPYLESTVHSQLFPVPAPEFELIIFVLRMVLKYSLLDSPLRSIFRKSTSSSPAVREELAYLEAQADRSRVYAILKRHLPFVGATLFNACGQSLLPGCPSWTRLAVRQQLQYRLKAHARRSQIADATLKVERRILKLIRVHILRQSSRKHLAGGGKIIALVGGDGAGKSTSVNELNAWLCKKFVTKTVHLGKPPRSMVTLAVIVALRLRRLFNGWRKRYSTVSSPAESKPSAFPGYLQLFRWVCAAQDRHRLYVKARRFATNGGVVICDRYPIPQVQSMDGPKIGPALNTVPINRLVKFLLKAETRYYQQIMPPDLLLVLKLDPEIAVRRKVDEDEAHVRGRSRELWNANWSGTRANVIDASQPIEDVIARLQTLIWAEL
jgi:thymidylate kinase